MAQSQRNARERLVALETQAELLWRPMCERVQLVEKRQDKHDFYLRFAVKVGLAIAFSGHFATFKDLGSIAASYFGVGS